MAIPSLRVAGHSLGTWARYGWLKTKSALGEVAGKTIGYAELAGFRYPVTPYQSRVSAGLTRGSRVSVDQIHDLKTRGFRSIVALTAESNSDAAPSQQAGMRYLHVPILDNDVPTRGQIRQFLDFVTSPENAPAYVHCEAGVGRTGVAVAAYRIAVEGWTAGQALAEAKKMGLKQHSQRRFVREFARDIADGKLPGYPLTQPAR